jgi:P-type conjugative transfer protein TrbJ
MEVSAMPQLLVFPLLVIFFLILPGAPARAIEVYDPVNHAENLVTAREAVSQTLQQAEMLRTQVAQYQRMLQDALNPGQWVWGDLADPLADIQKSLAALRRLADQAGGWEGLGEVFPSHSSYRDGRLFQEGGTGLYRSDRLGGELQAEGAAALLKLVEEEERSIADCENQLAELKATAMAAPGQQAALQAANQFASLTLERLTRLNTLLASREALLAGKIATDNARQAREAFAAAQRRGESSLERRESAPGGRSFGFF